MSRTTDRERNNPAADNAWANDRLEPRPTCYTCFRPQAHCVCGRVTCVNNRTGITIVQHPRERFHPFGTVRLVKQALDHCEVVIGWPPPRPELTLALPGDAGVLFPSNDALDLASLPAGDCPSHLVVLDGTWWQARSLYRDHSVLRGLPCYRLPGTTRSNYRIRKQPADYCVSTLESIVEALAYLEPETKGLDGLLKAFADTVDFQIATQDARHSVPRGRRRRNRKSKALDEALLVEEERLVVVFGESSKHHNRSDSRRRELLQWVAVRPATGETFEAFLASPEMPDACYRNLMRLSAEDLEEALELSDFRQAWEEFLRPGDQVISWSEREARLLAEGTGIACTMTPLKRAYCNVRGGPCGGLGAILAREELTAECVSVRGRAAERLGNAVRLLMWLREQHP